MFFLTLLRKHLKNEVLTPEDVLPLRGFCRLVFFFSPPHHHRLWRYNFPATHPGRLQQSRPRGRDSMRWTCHDRPSFGGYRASFVPASNGQKKRYSKVAILPGLDWSVGKVEAVTSRVFPKPGSVARDTRQPFHAGRLRGDSARSGTPRSSYPCSPAPRRPR